MSGLPDRPIPIRSTATHHPPPVTPGSTRRHKKDEVGLPCRNKIASPRPPAANAMWEPSTGTSPNAIPGAGQGAGPVTSARSSLTARLPSDQRHDGHNHVVLAAWL